MSTNPDDIIARLEAATAGAEASELLLATFVQGQVDDLVELPDGPIPTLRGLLEEVRNRAGSRRWHIPYSVNDLTRFEMNAEPFFGIMFGENFIVDKALSSCAFRLNVAPTAEVSLKLMFGTQRFDVIFAAGSQTGVVQNPSDDLIHFPAGTQLEVSLNSYARGGSQLRLTLGLMLEEIYGGDPVPG